MAGIPRVDSPVADLLLHRVHHWSGRTPWDRNKALWCGFAIELPGGKIFFAGDTGHNTIRLSYSLPSEAEIEQGIGRLAALVKGQLTHAA